MIFSLNILHRICSLSNFRSAEISYYSATVLGWGLLVEEGILIQYLFLYLNPLLPGSFLSFLYPLPCSHLISLSLAQSISGKRDSGQASGNRFLILWEIYVQTPVKAQQQVLIRDLDEKPLVTRSACRGKAGWT